MSKSILKHAPLTNAQKQARRRAPLNEIAHEMGWESWYDYERAVKHRVVKVSARPADWISRTRSR